MGRVRLPHHQLCVTEAMRWDLAVWDTFLQEFNGVSFWREDLKLEGELQVMSDASGSVGFGVYFHGHWCTEEWPQQWVQAGITFDLIFLEFPPILVAVRGQLANLAFHSKAF